MQPTEKMRSLDGLDWEWGSFFRVPFFKSVPSERGELRRLLWPVELKSNP